MSTKYTKTENSEYSISTGHEGSNPPVDFEIPSCTIEDVDKAVFSLFDKEISLYYVINNETRRIPVIFATGERFAILRRKKPLRDENNVVILPLISILRSGIEQLSANSFGPGENFQLTIKRRLSAEDPRYQRLINKLGFKNAYTISDAVPIGMTRSGSPKGVEGTRRETYGLNNNLVKTGNVLRPKLNNNFIETIEMPPIKYFKAMYDITVWTQYTKQMNDILSVIMSSYTNNQQREFRLETDKGYWFTGNIGTSFKSGDNFDDFSNTERVIKYSFDMSVTAYQIEPNAPSQSTGLRSYISAPTLEFILEDSPANPMPIGGPPSGDVNAYILQDLDSDSALIPGAAMGSDSISSAAQMSTGESGPGAYRASSDPRNPNGSAPTQKSTSVGTSSTGPGTEIISRKIYDETTGKTKEILIRVKGRNSRKGETVLRGEVSTILEDIII